jgi:hypothetical protein
VFGTTGANRKAAGRVVAPRRVEPIANEAFIGCEHSFRNLTARFKLASPSMREPIIFPAIEIG